MHWSYISALVACLRPATDARIKDEWKKYNTYTIMKKPIQIVFVLCLLVYACQFETSTNLGISIEDSELARISDGKIQSSDDEVFLMEEDIHLILYNVG